MSCGLKRFSCVVLVFAMGLVSVVLGASEPAQRRVVVLGDSLAAGYGLDPAESFPAVLQEKALAAGLPFKVVNAGVSGDTTAGGVRRLKWVLRQPAEVVLIELGGNDGLRGIAPEATRSNLVAMVDYVRAAWPRARVLLAEMEMPPNLGDDYTRAFREVFGAVAREKGVTLIPELLAGVGGFPEMNQADRIHPTSEGHRRIAENIWPILRPVLEEAAGVR